MAITAGVCNSFKQEVMEGVHDLENDTLKLALYTSSATIGPSTTAYTASNEVASGSGYITGGETVANVAVTLDSSTGIVDFDDVDWSNASFTARGALLYNSSQSNKAIAVLDFGSDVTVTNGTFRVELPAAAAATAILQLA